MIDRPSKAANSKASRTFWLTSLGDTMDQMRCVFLVGFMGAGKTMVAQQLATRLGWAAVDLDARIEAHEQRSVAEIFSKDGEAYFRHVEREALRSLGPQRDTVVATGGGTFSIKQADISGAMSEAKCNALHETGANRVISQDCGCLVAIC